MECERQVDGHVEPQTEVDYVCSMCKHSGFEPVPMHAETEDQETHIHIDTDTQPAQSDMNCEPAKTESTELGQTVTKSLHEVGNVTEHKESGKISLLIWLLHMDFMVLTNVSS